MPRLVIPLALALAWCLSATAAYPSPAARTAPTRRVPTPVASERTPSFRLTEASEVLLDDMPCRFADVPDDAVIVRLEITPVGTVLRIAFRSETKAPRPEARTPRGR